MEEVARVYGYNRFANTLPTALPVVAHPLAAAEAAVRSRLLALGYSEAISSSFASEADGVTFAAKGRGVVALENPLSEEARLLRPSLVPGMLAMLAHNLNRDVREVRLFEQGAVFTGSAAEVVESPGLSLGLTGDLPATRLHSAKDAGIFELKGVVESLLSLFAASPDALSTSAAGGVDVFAGCACVDRAWARRNGVAGRRADCALRRIGRKRARGAQAASAGLSGRDRSGGTLPASATAGYGARAVALPGGGARLLVHLCRCGAVADDCRDGGGSGDSGVDAGRAD